MRRYLLTDDINIVFKFTGTLNENKFETFEPGTCLCSTIDVQIVYRRKGVVGWLIHRLGVKQFLLVINMHHNAEGWRITSSDFPNRPGIDYDVYPTANFSVLGLR